MGLLDVLSDRVDPLVGAMLGKDYRVIEPIGRGGMAVVYLVERQTLRKRFAARRSRSSSPPTSRRGRGSTGSTRCRRCRTPPAGCRRTAGRSSSA
jgi:hypothetical protein